MFVRLGGAGGISIEPFLNFGPNEQQFSGCWLEIMDILFQFLFPNEVSNGTWCHLNATAEFDCG